MKSLRRAWGQSAECYGVPEPLPFLVAALAVLGIAAAVEVDVPNIFRQITIENLNMPTSQMTPPITTIGIPKIGISEPIIEMMHPMNIQTHAFSIRIPLSSAYTKSRVI